MGLDLLARHKKRLLVSMAFLLLSLFVVGSGKATSNYLARESKTGAEKQLWQDVNADIKTELPIERASEWDSLSRGTPRIFVEANTMRLAPVSAAIAMEQTDRKGSFGRLLICMFEEAGRNN